MLNVKASSQDTIGAMLTRAASANGHAQAGGVFSIECRDSEGNLKWSEALHNLVVNVGLQDMNSKYFSGSSYTATWYIGLYGAAASNNPAAADTMSSHAGWTEIVHQLGFSCGVHHQRNCHRWRRVFDQQQHQEWYDRYPVLRF